MKTLALVLLFASLAAHAKAAEGYAPTCEVDAIRAVAKSAKTTEGNVSVTNVVLLGDGIDGLEVYETRVSGQQGFYFVSLELDDCSLFNSAKNLAN